MTGLKSRAKANVLLVLVIQKSMTDIISLELFLRCWNLLVVVSPVFELLSTRPTGMQARQSQNEALQSLQMRGSGIHMGLSKGYIFLVFTSTFQGQHRSAPTLL